MDHSDSDKGDVFREKMDERIARGLENSAIKPYIDISLGWRPANIREVLFKENSLVLVTELPFPLFPPSDDPGEHPGSRSDQQRIRQEFVRYLLQNQSQLSRFYFTQLVNFLIDTRVSKKCGPSIMKLLKRIPQRYLAGRPARPIPPAIAHQIRAEAELIKKDLIDIRANIRKMKKNDKQLAIDKIRKNLLRTYPPVKFLWMSHFLAMATSLPRRRYLRSSLDDQDFADTPEGSQKIRTCTLLEPENWATGEIIVRILQKRFTTQGNPQYPLRAIRNLLKNRNQPHE